MRDGRGRPFKDLITIRDSNYYPNDIEITVQDCHPVLLSGRGAVFSVTPKQGADQQLVVVQEVDRDHAGEDDLTDVVATIRATITEHHGIEPHCVVLVEQMRIPTTSSGKIQRGSCRQQFLGGRLQALTEWQAPPLPDDHTGTKGPPEAAAAVAGLIKAAKARQYWGSGRG